MGFTYFKLCQLVMYILNSFLASNTNYLYNYSTLVFYTVISFSHKHYKYNRWKILKFVNYKMNIWMGLCYTVLKFTACRLLKDGLACYGSYTVSYDLIIMIRLWCSYPPVYYFWATCPPNNGLQYMWVGHKKSIWQILVSNLTTMS